MMYCPAHHESLPCAACAENLGRRADMTHRFQVVAVKCPDDVSGGAEWSCKYPTTCGEKGECCRNDDAVCTEHEPAGNINAETLKRHVSPGIPLSHELDRLRKYDEAAAEPSSLRLTLEFCATTAGEMAEWLTNSARCESPSFDAPPEPVSQFDSELLQASQEMFRLRDELIATLSKVGGAGTAPEPADRKALIDRMVRRFLGWPLPKSFSPDCGITFDGRGKDAMGYEKTWPIGTNLLNADEARALIEHALGDELVIRQQKTPKNVAQSQVGVGVGAGAAPAGAIKVCPLSDAACVEVPIARRCAGCLVAALSAQPEAGVTPTDTQLLNMVRDESMDLRSFVMPTGAGDADIGWRVISFHMDEPKERTVAEAFHDDPREALRQAYMAHTFNRVALGPVGSSGEAPKPQQSQSAWATRQKLARDGARDVLAKEEAQEGGEPRGMALENALRNIEEACNYSPYREMDKWDAPLAQLIHHHARLLAAAALKEQ